MYAYNKTIMYMNTVYTNIVLEKYGYIIVTGSLYREPLCGNDPIRIRIRQSRNGHVYCKPIRIVSILISLNTVCISYLIHRNVYHIHVWVYYITTNELLYLNINILFINVLTLIYIYIYILEDNK